MSICVTELALSDRERRQEKSRAPTAFEIIDAKRRHIAAFDSYDLADICHENFDVLNKAIMTNSPIQLGNLFITLARCKLERCINTELYGEAKTNMEMGWKPLEIEV